MAVGDRMPLGPYTLQMRDLSESDTPNYTASKAQIVLTRGESQVGILVPERRFYKASRQPTTEVAIRPRLSEDVYIVYEGMSDDRRHAVISAHLNPLVNWIWIGGAVLVFGTLVALIPSRPSAGARPSRPKVEQYISTPTEPDKQHEVLVRSAT